MGPGARTLLSFAFGGISLYFLNKKRYYIKIITLRNKIAQYIFFKKVKMAKHLQTFLTNSSRPKTKDPNAIFTSRLARLYTYKMIFLPYKQIPYQNIGFNIRPR